MEHDLWDLRVGVVGRRAWVLGDGGMCGCVGSCVWR